MSDLGFERIVRSQAMPDSESLNSDSLHTENRWSFIYVAFIRPIWLNQGQECHAKDMYLEARLLTSLKLVRGFF